MRDVTCSRVIEREEKSVWERVCGKEYAKKNMQKRLCRKEYVETSMGKRVCVM